MAKNNNTIWIWIVVAVVVALLIGPQLGLFSISGNSMSRDVPTTVSPHQEFSVIYTASNSGTWGASIIDNVNGGCKFPDGSNQLKTVMLSTDGNSKTIKVTAPSSGSCTFSGNYKFGTEATKNFQEDTITITTGDGETVCCGTPDGPYYFREGSCNVGEQEFPLEVCENGNGNGNGEVSSFDLNKVLFKIGNFEVTLMMLLISLGGLFILKIIFSKE